MRCQVCGTVDDRRLGPCMKHQGKESKKQEKERQKRKEAEQNPTFDF